MKILAYVLPFVFFVPLFVFAGSVAPSFSTAESFVDKFVSFVNTKLVPAVFSIAFLIFLWGVFKTFILGGHDEEKQSEGKQLMMYSIAGFLLMASIWGLVNFFMGTFGFTGTESIPVPPRIGT